MLFGQTNINGIGQNAVDFLAPIAASLCLHLFLAGSFLYFYNRPDKVIWVDMLDVKLISPVKQQAKAHDVVKHTALQQQPTPVKTFKPNVSSSKTSSSNHPKEPTSHPTVKILENTTRVDMPVKAIPRETSEVTIHKQVVRSKEQTAKDSLETPVKNSETRGDDAGITSDLNNGSQARHSISQRTKSSEDIGQGYVREQFAYIRERVLDRLVYPPLARRQGWTGEVLVGFTILGDGNIEKLNVVTSSGRTLLDRQALRAVQKAAPFPAPPSSTSIVLPVTFEIHSARR